jgi:hypothetical protein
MRCHERRHKTEELKPLALPVARCQNRPRLLISPRIFAVQRHLGSPSLPLGARSPLSGKRCNRAFE